MQQLRSGVITSFSRYSNMLTFQNPIQIKNSQQSESNRTSIQNQARQVLAASASTRGIIDSTLLFHQKVSDSPIIEVVPTRSAPLSQARHFVRSRYEIQRNQEIFKNSASVQRLPRYEKTPALNRRNEMRGSDAPAVQLPVVRQEQAVIAEEGKKDDQSKDQLTELVAQ